MLETAPFLSSRPGSQPPLDAPAYLGTAFRRPLRPALRIPATVTEATGPQFAAARFPAMADLSVKDGKQAAGERIIVQGRVTDENGRPVPATCHAWNR